MGASFRRVGAGIDRGLAGYGQTGVAQRGASVEGLRIRTQITTAQARHLPFWKTTEAPRGATVGRLRSPFQGRFSAHRARSEVKETRKDGVVMKTIEVAAAAALVSTIGGSLWATSALPSGSEASAAPPTVNSGQFQNPQQNEYFPLEPGTVSRYRGTEDGEKFRERVVVTKHTKLIEGVTTTVVRDVLRRADGTLAERTRDWYAPDDDGNVWYFGEATATYDETGNLESREGSWQAGVDGAVAGTIMPATPRPADAYRQEFYRGHAEDQAWIVQRNTSAKVPYGTFQHVVRSFEWTRLEKGVLSLKLYAPGIGIVREKDMSGGNESFALVAVRHR